MEAWNALTPNERKIAEKKIVYIYHLWVDQAKVFYVWKMFLAP